MNRKRRRIYAGNSMRFVEIDYKLVELLPEKRLRLYLRVIRDKYYALEADGVEAHRLEEIKEYTDYGYQLLHKLEKQSNK